MTKFITRSKETDDMMRDRAKTSSHRTGFSATLRALGGARGTGASPAPGIVPRGYGSLPVLALTLLGCLALLVFGTSVASAAETPTVGSPTVTPGYTTAEVSGSIDTHGEEATVYAEFATEPGGAFTFVPIATIAAGEVGPTPVSGEVTGLKTGTEYFFRLDAEVAGVGETYSPEPYPRVSTKVLPPPTVSIKPVTTFTATTAHFEGTIDPGGNDPAFDVSWHFECNPECPGLNGSITADESSHTVEADAEGLQPNRSYEVELVAENAGSSASAGPEDFTTGAAAPTVSTIHAMVLPDGTSAVLGGRVNPNNQPTTYWFEYGTTAAYSQRIPVSGGLNAGSGGESEQVAQEITGLAPATTYHFRVVAENSTDRSPGEDMTVQIPASAAGCSNEQVRAENNSLNLPECRAYELVTPQDTNNGDISPNTFGPVAAPTGDLVTYNLTQAFGDEVEGFGTHANYAAGRGPGDWQSYSIQPPNAPRVEGSYPAEALAITADLSEELVLTNTDPSTGEPIPGGEVFQGPQAFYLRDNTTGTYQLVTLVPAGVAAADIDGALTPDGSAAFIAVNGTLRRYETATGQLDDVAILPDGNESSPAGIAGGQQPSLHSFSDDGNIVFFTDASEAVYRRNLKAPPTVPINASENSGQVVPLGQATFQGASADGSRAFFWSEQPLVDGDTNTENDLYLYDATKPAGERLTAVTSNGSFFPGRIIKMSEDGRRVYFTDEDQLVPGVPSAPSFSSYLYLWDDTGSTPVLKYIASLRSVDSGLVNQSSISADGRYFAFIAATPGITGNETGGFAQAYLYEADGSRATVPDIACASCVAPPAVSTADAAFQPEHSVRRTWGGHLTRNISATGQLFFETQGALLPEDTNGHSDVYEYANGQLHLISSGRGEYDAYFGDASTNAEDVYIYTGNALTPTHSGDHIALYDARVGGGFAVPSRQVPCESDQCQGSASTPPGPAAIGSVSFTGGGNGTQSPVKASVAVKSMKASGSTARLKVRVPGAGRISVSGSQVQGAHKSVPKAGSYQVTVALKPAARKRLKKSASQGLRVKVLVSYQPQGGRSATKTIQVTFKQPKPKRAKAGKGGR